jgi:hypothetical protein
MDEQTRTCPRRQRFARRFFFLAGLSTTAAGALVTARFGAAFFVRFFFETRPARFDLRPFAFARGLSSTRGRGGMLESFGHDEAIV